ncbi:MAG: hypothetical protein R2727_03195 [Bacteroidales bacterium]
MGIARELKSMAFTDEPGKEDIIVILPKGSVMPRTSFQHLISRTIYCTAVKVLQH